MKIPILVAVALLGAALHVDAEPTSVLERIAESGQRALKVADYAGARDQFEGG